MAIKILIGGSPCTYWSIAQKNNRETEAEGMGWELFKNYLIAKQIAMKNYPDIIQMGDAFAVREDDWKPPRTRSEWLDELLRS